MCFLNLYQELQSSVLYSGACADVFYYGKIMYGEYSFCFLVVDVILRMGVGFEKQNYLL